MARCREYEHLANANRRDLPSVNLTIWTIAVHCALVAADVVMVSSR
jgi:hypothetical protein